MHRFKNILLVADGKKVATVALERAATLARSNEARLTVADVIEALPREVQLLSAAVELADLWEMIIEERRKRLDRLIGPLRQSGVCVIAKVLRGPAFLEIIREVLRGQHDLVMIAAEAEGIFKETIFGSTSMHLMRKCPCPVWVMKPSSRARYTRVLAAVDPAPSNEENNSLNIRIMELATSLARLEGSHLHIVYAWSPISESVLRSRLPPNMVRKIIRETEEACQKGFAELLQKFRLEDLKVQLHLSRGAPGEVIPALARRKRIEVIVMGTVCRTGIAGLLIGNTAETILRQVKCSVLTVKPDGFVTPVQTLDNTAAKDA